MKKSAWGLAWGLAWGAAWGSVSPLPAPPEVQWLGGGGSRNTRASDYDYLGPRAAKAWKQAPKPIKKQVAKLARKAIREDVKIGSDEYSSLVEDLIRAVEENDVLWKKYYANLIGQQIAQQTAILEAQAAEMMELELIEEEELFLLSLL